MKSIIDAAVARSRPVLLVLVLVLISGSVAYVTIPKESDPDVAIPIIYILIPHDGISAEDAERLLVRPMEKELRNVEGLKEMRASARQGQATITLEFEAGFDSDQALNDVREKVDIAKVELPDDSDEPTVNEVNVALFPVILVTLSGDIGERTLVRQARDLRDKLEALPGILEVDIAGNREDLVEVIIDPMRLEGFNQSPEILLQFIDRNNKLVAAGAMDTGHGRFSVKVPGLFENVQDVLDLPIKTSGDKVVTFEDVAIAHRTFKDANGFARVNGQPAVALEVTKRIGTNIIDTIEEVRAVVAEEQENWPDAIRVAYSQDKSRQIRDMLNDLQNNVLAAVLLVMIVVVAALGVRTAGLVGVSIPGSFLAGILVLAFAGLTINIVVLFGLIMAVGMLVDGTIVVVELADRKMAEGLPRQAAYAGAAKRMAWPITAATATTLAAFMPLLFWPGIVGEFMKYLPITLIATLTASLFMALVFVPTLGSIIGRRAPDSVQSTASLATAQSGDLDSITGLTGAYVKVLRVAVSHPVKLVGLAAVLLTGAYASYGVFGKGFVDVTDSRPMPGIEWQVKVDRAEASRYGADITAVGNAIKLVTNGIKVGEYRPDDTDDEVEIRVRFPYNDRNIDELDRLRVPTASGAVPIGNFVERVAVPRVGTINRADSRRMLKVQAEVPEGVLPDDKVTEIKHWLKTANIDPRVAIEFKGEDEEQRQAEAFLVKAFGIALFIMAIILVTQFNSFYQALLILSAVVLSTVGVLLGLLVTGKPFGIVMSGVGVIALAGIVVNNNIVLIDTYNILRRRGMDTIEAVMRTGTQRLRPVLLTTITTVLGLMPMVLGINIDLIDRSISVGGPSTQWWTQLASAVAGGLTFATLLTLVLTPSLLVLGERLKFGRWNTAEKAVPAATHSM